MSEVLNHFQLTPIAVKPLTTETDIIVPVYNGVVSTSVFRYDSA